MEIASIIKYEGDNSTFIWKHPKEDFNTSTQLIVHESQEAIFYMNGQALDLFGPGRYTLETQNIPLLRKVTSIPTNGQTPFHCEVYYINKTEQMAIRWGTDSKVQYIEPTYGFPIYIGANGELSLAVDDSRKLLIKLVGTEKTLDQQSLIRYFRAVLMTKIKTYIAQTIKVEKINIFEIDENLEHFSSTLHLKLIPDFKEYGLLLKRFFVTTIVKPDADPQYQKFKELYFRQYADITEAKIKQEVGVIEQDTARKRMIIAAQAIAEKRKTEGYTYQQERGFDVAEKAASNEGAGQLTSTAIGLGMMAGVGGVISNTVERAVSNATSIPSNPLSDQVIYCDNCGAQLEQGTQFCDNCGIAIQQSSVCNNCGFRFTRPGKFCPKCGNRRE